MSRLLYLFCCVVSAAAFPAFNAQGAGLDVPVSISITDAAGNQITATEPGRQIGYAAVYPFERPGIALLRGTVSCGQWSRELAPKIRAGLRGTCTVTWSGFIPLDTVGDARVDIILIRPLFGRTVSTAFFEITPFEADYVGSQGCRTCHSSRYAAWQQTRHAPVVGCETCHGPGSLHRRSQSPEDIARDPTSQLCRPCHSLNDATILEAADGFIKHQQQYTEFTSTKHGRYMECATCHDPHYSPALAREQAIKVACKQCHPANSVHLNMRFVDCQSCHMPRAVLRDTSTGEGDYRAGDTAAHIWRIKTEAPPNSMFTRGGAAAAKDWAGPFLTLNFACLTCHNGNHARFADFDYVQQTSTLVH